MVAAEGRDGAEELAKDVVKLTGDVVGRVNAKVIFEHARGHTMPHMSRF